MSPFEEYYWAAVTVLARHIARKTPPHRPHRPSVTFLRETPGMLVYTLNLPAPVSSDVTRRVEKSLNGSTPFITFNATDGMEVTCARSDAVSIVVIDTSPGGVDSDPSDALLFEGKNPNSPAKPGTPSVTFLREEADPAPVAVDPTTETPAA